jgi:hypothetical protein
MNNDQTLMPCGHHTTTDDTCAGCYDDLQDDSIKVIEALLDVTDVKYLNATTKKLIKSFKKKYAKIY